MIGQQMLLEDGTLVTPIHFLYQDEAAKRIGIEWRMACQPHLTNFSASEGKAVPFMRTAEANAVTCPICKMTPMWAEAMNRGSAVKAAREYVS